MKVRPSPADPNDAIGDRSRLLRIGMASVLFACVLFAAARLGLTLATGKSTPWWANALCAITIACLYQWYRRSPEERSGAAAHVTALAATVALIVPVFYGMPSTIWWLGLVGYAMVLLGRRREAWLWGLGTPLLVAAAWFAQGLFQIPGAAGELPLESFLGRVAFAVLLVSMAAGFRQVANARALALSRATAARSAFLEHMSHQLRTPLHGTLSMMELALHSDLHPSARRQLESARQSAGRLLGLLNDILDVTRFESGGLELSEESFDLHRLLTELLRPQAELARGRGVVLRATADAGLPAMRIGDRHRVAQIVGNLAENAVRFTTEGRIDIRLRGDSLDRDFLKLEFRDSGPGVAPELRAELFEPFAQGEAARSGRGAGLGLTIVRELSRRMGGDASIETGPDGQAYFLVSLRLEAVGSSPGPENLLAPVPGSGDAHSPARGSLSILACEDEPVNQKVLSMMLRHLGHRVTLVATAEEAWSALLAGDYDLLLTDIELPGMNGAELVRRIRAREREQSLPRLPVVAGTAHVGTGERDWLLSAGIDVHLPKPFDVAALRGALSLATRDSAPHLLAGGA